MDIAKVIEDIEKVIEDIEKVIEDIEIQCVYEHLQQFSGDVLDPSEGMVIIFNQRVELRKCPVLPDRISRCAVYAT